MEKPKIKECFPLVNGLWDHINYTFPEIFDITSSQLDILFLSNFSMRTPAPIIHVIHDSAVQLPLSNEELETLAGIINGMYKHKWDKMMDAAMLEYDPIHNYNDHLTEEISYEEGKVSSKTGSGTSSNTRTDNLSKSVIDSRTYTDTYNVTDTQTDARTITETRNLNNSGSDSQQDNIYGFNSSAAVGEGNSSGSNSNLETGTVQNAHSGNLTDKKTGTEGRTYGGGTTENNTGTQTNGGTESRSESGSDDTSGTRTREYTKTGNIGNISTQKLIGEELELWKYNFIYEMMQDVAKLVTLPIYEM